MITIKKMPFIMAMSLALGIVPIPALAQNAVINDNDQNIQINVATQTQNADELVDDDDQGEGGSNPSNNGATINGGEFQTARAHQENNLEDNDVNTINLNQEVADSSGQTDQAAESNDRGHGASSHRPDIGPQNSVHTDSTNRADININTNVNASGG